MIDRTPGCFSASVTSIDRIRAWGWGERRMAASSVPF
jgi:hypothetical protein